MGGVRLQFTKGRAKEAFRVPLCFYHCDSTGISYSLGGPSDLQPEKRARSLRRHRIHQCHFTMGIGPQILECPRRQAAYTVHTDGRANVMGCSHSVASTGLYYGFPNEMYPIFQDILDFKSSGPYINWKGSSTCSGPGYCVTVHQDVATNRCPALAAELPGWKEMAWG